MKTVDEHLERWKCQKCGERLDQIGIDGKDPQGNDRVEHWCDGCGKFFIFYYEDPAEIEAEIKALPSGD